MLNYPSQWRTDLVRQIAPAFTRNPKVRAVMLAGSASRNSSDAYSDIEIGVFWEAPPSPEERDEQITAAGGAFWERDPYDEVGRTWMEEWGLGDLKMDVRHMTLAGLEEVLVEVLERHQTGAYNQVTLAALQYAVPLHNAPLITQWQARLTPYPEGLRLAMVRENLSFAPLWLIEVYAQRAEWPLLYKELTSTVQAILRMLIGLNQLYYPGLKWLTRLMGDLKIAPANLQERIQLVLRAEPALAVPEVGRLTLETYALLEQYLPSLAPEIVFARAAFLKRRLPVEHPPLLRLE